MKSRPNTGISLSDRLLALRARKAQEQRAQLGCANIDNVHETDQQIESNAPQALAAGVTVSDLLVNLNPSYPSQSAASDSSSNTASSTNTLPALNEQVPDEPAPLPPRQPRSSNSEILAAIKKASDRAKARQAVEAEQTLTQPSDEIQTQTFATQAPPVPESALPSDIEIATTQRQPAQTQITEETSLEDQLNAMRARLEKSAGQTQPIAIESSEPNFVRVEDTALCDMQASTEDDTTSSLPEPILQTFDELNQHLMNDIRESFKQANISSIRIENPIHPALPEILQFLSQVGARIDVLGMLLREDRRLGISESMFSAEELEQQAASSPQVNYGDTHLNTGLSADRRVVQYITPRLLSQVARQPNGDYEQRIWSRRGVDDDGQPTSAIVFGARQLASHEINERQRNLASDQLTQGTSTPDNEFTGNILSYVSIEGERIERHLSFNLPIQEDSNEARSALPHFEFIENVTENLPQGLAEYRQQLNKQQQNLDSLFHSFLNKDAQMEADLSELNTRVNAFNIEVMQLDSLALKTTYSRTQLEQFLRVNEQNLTASQKYQCRKLLKAFSTLIDKIIAALNNIQAKQQSYSARYQAFYERNLRIENLFEHYINQEALLRDQAEQAELFHQHLLNTGNRDFHELAGFESVLTELEEKLRTTITGLQVAITMARLDTQAEERLELALSRFTAQRNLTLNALSDLQPMLHTARIGSFADVTNEIGLQFTLNATTAAQYQLNNYALGMRMRGIGLDVAQFKEGSDLHIAAATDVNAFKEFVSRLAHCNMASARLEIALRTTLISLEQRVRNAPAQEYQALSNELVKLARLFRLAMSMINNLQIASEKILYVGMLQNQQHLSSLLNPSSALMHPPPAPDTQNDEE